MFLLDRSISHGFKCSNYGSPYLYRSSHIFCGLSRYLPAVYSVLYSYCNGEAQVRKVSANTKNVKINTELLFCYVECTIFAASQTKNLSVIICNFDLQAVLLKRILAVQKKAH